MSKVPIKIPEEVKESLSSIEIEMDSRGQIKPTVKVYAKSNMKKDIDSACKWAKEYFDTLLKHYNGTT